MSCGRSAGPTPSQEIIGQLNCANVGPLNCMSGGGPTAPSVDCGGGGGGGGRSMGGGRTSSMLTKNRDMCGEDSGATYAEGCQRVMDCMNRLWQEQKICDVIIQAQCDQLKAHKLALAAYSDFLVEKFCKFPAGCVGLL